MKKSTMKKSTKKNSQAAAQAAPSFDYAPPLDQLLALGDLRSQRAWRDYLQMGLSEEHVPQLIRLATDKDLLWADSDSAETWAPIHAWRALGQLRATAAVEPLLNLLDELIDDDWIHEDLPRVFRSVGAPALPALRAYLSDAAHDMYGRATAARCLEEIGNHDRSAHAACVEALMRQLEQFARNEPEFNGFLLSSLLDLHASEALPLIEGAFAAGCIDESIAGDWPTVRVEFGLPPGGQNPFASAPAPRPLGTYTRFLQDPSDQEPKL